MKHLSRIIFFLLIANQALFAIVGDWKSYGSTLTMKDIFRDGGMLHIASRGGMLSFDISEERFLPYPHRDKLAHIDIHRFYVNPDGSRWFSYYNEAGDVTAVSANERISEFDFSLDAVTAFAGNTETVFAVYKEDFTPGLIHFVQHQNRFIFQDFYDRFPGDPAELYDVAILGDSLYVAGDLGLYKTEVNHSNLKPANAWTLIPVEEGSAVLSMHVYDEKLYFITGDGKCYERDNAVNTFLFHTSGNALAFSSGADGLLYYASDQTVYRVNDTQELYRSDAMISGFYVSSDTLWLAREDRGLQKIDLSGGTRESYIPNTMLSLQANSLAISGDGKLYVCGIDGLSVLDGLNWHNYVFSPYKENISDQKNTDGFSSDTLNIAYRIGGQTSVYDALISASGELYYTLTDVSIFPVSGQSPDAQGPGALLRFNLNDPSDYAVYDTSGGLIVGTQNLGGSSWYLKMRGLQEDQYGNIWALNVHTLDARPLIKIRPDGSVQKYSVESSGNTLQILAREMVFDRSGRLWIANEARQSDVPRTEGGITVFDPQSGVWRLINSSDGLISNDVYAIDIDPLSGNIWAATASGVQMIRSPSTLTASTVFSLNPPLEGMSGILSKKIRIDPKGNKWILTQSQGVQIYLNNNTWYNEGKGLRRSNSGLMNDIVYDLVFDTREGYAYLLTASGLNRFETAWTATREEMEVLRIFPQPFVPGNDPLVIDGLAEQTQVSISTIDGRVIRTFTANAPENFGKQIIWDGMLEDGSPIPRGVYLVFARNIDGLRVTSKFAVK
jgi:hypothetical protein